MKKALSLFISLLMVLTLLPVSAIADTEGADPEPEAVVETTDEQQGPTEPDPEPTEGDAPAQTIEEPQVVVDPETVADPETTEDPETVQAGDGAEPQADEPETITISYSSADGNGSINKRDQVQAGAQVTLRGSTFTKSAKVNNDGLYGTQYTQDGWALSSGGNKKYELGETITAPSSDLSLYAHYAESEQVHWIVKVVGGGGQIKFVRGLNSQTEEQDTQIKVYVTAQRIVPTGIYRYFEGEPDSGYVFDGWYLDGEKMDQPRLVASMFETLTNTRIQDGKNVIEARFKQNAGNVFTVKYDRGDGYIYKEEAVEEGSPTPAYENPYYKNHYFLGWTPTVSATVTGDVTYTATWLEGPSTSLGNVGGLDPDNENTFFTLRCVTGVGVDGTSHDDMGRNASQFESNDDITFDGTTYRATVSITGLGAHLLWATDSYDRAFQQEHFGVERTPVVRVKWDEDRMLWVPDGEQIVEIYHETGMEEVSAAEQKSFNAICVTDVNNPDTYKSLKLIPGTYTLSDPVLDTTGGEYVITATVTDFDAYAAQLGADYAVDWDSNLHGEDYYVFYFVNKLSMATCANGDPYYHWSGSNFSPMMTEWQSTGGVKHNEFLDGKELLVKEAHTHVWSDPEYVWTQNGDDWQCTATRTCAGCEEVETETVTAICTDDGDKATYTATFTNEAFETQTKEVEIGYYLIGSLTNWQVDEAYRFAPNGAAGGEYILSTTLAVNDAIKAVRAEGSRILTWYPDGTDNNYVVDYAHSGSVNVYFRPDGQGGSDWHYGVLYISKLHTVTVIPDGHGTVALNPETPDVTATVYVTFTPEEGYCLDRVEFFKKTGAGENDLEAVTLDSLNWNDEAKTFTMPDFDVVIKVYFKEIPVYTITFDVHDEMYDRASFDDGRNDYYIEEEWAPRTAREGDKLQDYLPSAFAEEHWRQYYTVVYQKYLLDGWMTEDGEPVTADSIVTGDVVIRPMKVELPDVTRIVDYIVSGPEDEDPSFGTSGYSKVENVTGTPVILRCLSDENDTISLTGYDAMGLFSGGALQVDEYEKAADGTWTGRIHLRYQSYNWSGMIHSLTSGHNVTSGLMTYLVETGKIGEFHKLVDNSFPSQGYKDGGYVEVRYDRDTEKWEFTTTKTIDIYCGFQLIYVDNNGESEPFYVKPDENGQATLPAFEGDLTPPVEGAVFLGYRDNWNKPANPGDEGYTRTNANGDPVYSTATFFVPMGVEYLESYPSVPNADDTLFSLTCETDLFEEGHEVPVTYRLLQAAGVTPEFGELDTFNGMYFVQDISLTAAQIDQVLDYLSGEDIQGNGILRDYFLEMRHQLVDEEPLTIQMICLDVDVPEDWAPAAGTGALPGGLSTMGVGGGSDAEPMTLTLGNRTPIVTGGTWEPLAPLMGEEPAALSMRCMVNAFFLNAQADSEAFDWEDPLGYLEENGDEIIFEPCTGMPFLIQDEENGGWMPNPDLEELLSWFAPEALAEELDEEGRALLTNEEGMFFTGWKAMTFAGEEVVPFPEVLDQNLILFPVFEEPRVIICNANVYFEGQIHLSFGFDGDTLPEGGTVRISKEGHNNNDTVQETDVADGVLVNGKMEYYLPVMIPEFADQVTVQVLDAEGNLLPIRSQNGTEYGTEGFHYSVKRYAERKIENGTTAEVRALAQALLDYGTAAQIYFTYGEYTGLSVSELVTGVTAQDLIDGGFAMVTTPAEDRPEGVKASIKVYFESDNTLRITYSGLKGGTTYTYTLDGETVTPASSFLQVEYIAAPNLDVPHTFTISDGTKTFSVQASAMSYALTCIRNGTEARQNLGKAFYLYNQAANAFFETNG